GTSRAAGPPSSCARPGAVARAHRLAASVTAASRSVCRFQTRFMRREDGLAVGRGHGFARHRLAVDQALARFEPGGGPRWEGSVGTSMPVPREHPDAGAVTARHHAVAVVLDLVNPPAAVPRAPGGPVLAGEAPLHGLHAPSVATAHDDADIGARLLQCGRI